MKVSYKKLFKLLIDRDMKKQDLCKAANLSASSVTKLVNNKNVSMDVIVRTCSALQVDVGDILELIPDDD